MSSSSFSGDGVQDEQICSRLSVVTISNERERRKKTTGFSTLKRKFIRRKKPRLADDYSRIFRDLVDGWKLANLHSLVQEYEALSAVKALSIQASLSRLGSTSLRQDLLNLLKDKSCTDTNLIIKGTKFPVHRAILSARSPFFKRLLSSFPSEIDIGTKTGEMDISLLTSLLVYLYTGDLNSSDCCLDNPKTIMQLHDTFGVPNKLEEDLRKLLELGDYSDAVLVFQFLSNNKSIELPCHKAILAARSQFFRKLICRRESQEKETPIRIIIDGSNGIINPKYAKLLLKVIYLDQVDLSLIENFGHYNMSNTQCSTQENGDKTILPILPQIIKGAMDLFEIARFLEITNVAKSCENIIAENLSIETLMGILSWSSQPCGSQWVNRQCIHFLKEEFLAISNSPVLYELKENTLIELIKSDFLQASEVDIFKNIMKWGEYELIKRIEEREPNLLCHTAHSISKKGIKKRDLNPHELRDILQNLLPFVRVQHILPPNSEILPNATKNGFLSLPPSHLGNEDGKNSNLWVQNRKTVSNYVKPRLFFPFVEEAKAILDEQMIQAKELAHLKRIQVSPIPDTLYMLKEKSFLNDVSPSVEMASFLSVLDPEIVSAMTERAKDLMQTKPVKQAYSMLCADKSEITLQIHLKIIREFGLPDELVEVLKRNDDFIVFPDDKQGDTCLQGNWPCDTLANEISEPAKDLYAQSVPMLSDLMPDIAIPAGPDLTIAIAPPINQMLLRDSQLRDQSENNFIQL